MGNTPSRVILVFLDGVGIGEGDTRFNPFMTASLPALRALCGGVLPLLGAGGEVPVADPAGGWVPADAALGVPGRPQSGTGQTSLLTGENAAVAFGRHFGPWVPTGLREHLARRNLLSRAAAAGRAVAFANAHPEGAGRPRPPRRPAAPPLAALGAGLSLRGAEALHAGQAIASSITHERLHPYLPRLAPITARNAGANLARIAREADLTLFAHYDTDLIGHRRDLAGAIEVLNRVDGFLSGLVDAMGDDTLLVIASDHGNVEDVRVGHTINPVPVVATGPGAHGLLAGVASILDVTPAILRTLAVE